MLVDYLALDKGKIKFFITLNSIFDIRLTAVSNYKRFFYGQGSQERESYFRVKEHTERKILEFEIERRFINQISFILEG